MFRCHIHLDNILVIINYPNLKKFLVLHTDGFFVFPTLPSDLYELDGPVIQDCFHDIQDHTLTGMDEGLTLSRNVLNKSVELGPSKSRFK